MAVLSDGEYSDYEGCENQGCSSLQSKLRRAHCREKAERRQQQADEEREREIERLEAEAKLSPEERVVLEATQAEILKREKEREPITYSQACSMSAGHLWKRLKQRYSDVLRADLMALKNKEA